MNKLFTLTIAALLCHTSAATASTVTTSWYGKKWNGRTTASGEIFNHRKMTAAHKSLPLGTQLLVGHGNRKVLVRVNDRGPYVKGRNLDVSEAVAVRLGIKKKGVCRVHVQVINKPH